MKSHAELTELASTLGVLLGGGPVRAVRGVLVHEGFVWTVPVAKAFVSAVEAEARRG